MVTMMMLMMKIPSILAVYSAITPQRALNATVITQPLIWIERDYCIPFVNIIAAVNVIFSFTFLTVLGSTALTPLLLLPAATDLGHWAVVDSVAHLRLIEAGLLVPAKKCRRLAVNWSRAIPLVPSLRLRRQLWAVCCPVALLHLAIFLYFASLFLATFKSSLPCHTFAPGRSGARCPGKQSGCQRDNPMAAARVSAAQQVHQVAPCQNFDKDLLHISSRFLELTSRHQSTGKKFLILCPATLLPRTPPSRTWCSSR